MNRHTNSRSEKDRYDSAYRLASPESGSTTAGNRAFERGTFTDGDRDSMSTIAEYKDFDIDGAQNWSTVFNNSATGLSTTLSDFNELRSFDSLSHDYNKNGGMIELQRPSDGDFDMSYDALNRLTKVQNSDEGWNVTYAYDCGNRRRIKTVSTGGGPTGNGDAGTTHYYYSGWRVMEEYDFDSSTTTDSIEKQYAWGNYLDELWAVDDLSGGATLAQLNDGTGTERVFALANTLYSVNGVANESGQLIEAYEYDPYGQHTRISDGPDGDSIVNFSTDDVRTAGGKSAFGIDQLYTGQRFDAETDMHYYKNRYYLAEIGRFATRDPIGIWKDLINLGNGYSLVGYNLLDHLDPYGLEDYSLTKEAIKEGRKLFVEVNHKDYTERVDANTRPDLHLKCKTRCDKISCKGGTTRKFEVYLTYPDAIKIMTFKAMKPRRIGFAAFGFDLPSWVPWMQFSVESNVNKKGKPSSFCYCDCQGDIPGYAGDQVLEFAFGKEPCEKIVLGTGSAPPEDSYELSKSGFPWWLEPPDSWADD